jgi:hypothetical protein
MLIFEEARLSDETLNEIIMTAVALAEHARRHAWNEDSINLGESIGDYIGGRQRERSGAHQARGHQSHGGDYGGAILLSVGGDGGNCAGGDGGSCGGGDGGGCGGGC